MRKSLALLLSLFLFSLNHLYAQPSPRDKYVPGQVLVKFHATVSRAAINAAHSRVAADVVDNFSSVEGLQLIHIPSATKLNDALAIYRSNPDVEYAEPNYVVHAFQTPNDPLFPNMWSLLNTGQNGGAAGADIKATQAWDITTGSSNVVIAVIDTGVDYNHPDLAANIFTGAICPGGVICHGINLLPNIFHDGNDPFDDNGHGTHVSGTIGAIGNNNVGVTGINWNVTILPCKFLDLNGAGAVSDAIKCLDFIKNLKDTQGMNIVASNNSWGGNDFSQALQDAIDRQRQSGILFIAAAGNDSADNDVQPFYPAGFPLPNIIAVAATDRNDARAFFSNIGRHTVHIGAPGQDILSTLPGASYGLESGTSMAAPHVTGVAALLSAQDPTRDWRGIKNLVLAGGDLDPALAKTVSGKRLDAFGSLTCTNSVVGGRILPARDVVAGSVGVPVVLSALNINCAQPNGPVQVTVSPGGQTIQLSDDGVAPDVAAADGVYSGSFIPGATGVYTLAFSTGDTLTVQVLKNYSSGITAFNYRTITGTNLNLGDDGVAQIAPPFPVRFGDGSFSQLWISANGIISATGAVSSYLHMPLPTGSPFRSFTPLVSAETLVAPFWDDLVPQTGTPQNVFWDVTGTAPNRELVIEWRDVRTFDCFTEPDTVKFQVVFFENSSDILFNYADTTFGGSCVKHDRGALATVGVQIDDKTANMWGFEGQNVSDGMAILWKTSTNGIPAPPVPIITSISPTLVHTYDPSFVLTVNGSNFVPESRVTFFGTGRPTAFVSSTQLTAQVAATDLDPFLFLPFVGLGPVDVFVVTHTLGGTTQSNQATLTVAGANPTISTLSPASTPAGSFGFILTVTGDKFIPFSVVNWNGQPLISVAFSRTQVQAFVGGDLLVTPGIANVTVTDPNGGTSTALSFTITAGGAFPAAAVPSAYRIQQTPTSRSISTGRPNLALKKFLGWNFARKQGTQYMQQFLRSYGTLFTASGAESALSPRGVVSALAVAPALPGLDLPESLPAGFLPTGVAVGDFNHDGHLDWAVSNGGSNDVWLYLGNGDGTVQLPRIIPLSGSSPVAIAAVDLRGTGVLDLVLAEPDSLTVGVLLGNGDGTFAPEQLFFTPAPALCLTVADFNRDGHPDVVVGLVADNPVGAVAFFAGDGTGKLLPPVTTPTDSEFSPAAISFAITTGDLNNDGIPDLLVTDIKDIDGGTFVWLGQGDGTFKMSQNLGGILNAAIGDLNGDGCPDAVMIDVFGLAQVMLGHCDGTFQLLQPLGFFGEGETGISMALADVNGDGKLDLITGGLTVVGGPLFGQDSGSLVSVSFGDGAGAFEPARVYRAQSGMFGLAVADLNGDLHPDIVVASQDADSTRVLLNDGTGRFGGPQGRYIGWSQKGSESTNTLQGPANAPVFMTAADLDGDGKKDLVSVDFGRGFDLPWNLVISMNDGAGNFLPDKKIPVLDGRFQFFGNVALGDFRGTGLPDIVLTPNHLSTSFTGNFYVFIPNLGAGNFGTPIINNLPTTPGVIAAGDFNGDGKLDFVMFGGGKVLTFLGNGNGTFTTASSPSLLLPNPPQKLFIGDFNGDGKLDFLVPAGGGLVEFLGNGDGTFAPPKTVISNVGSFSDSSVLFDVVDLNHDGRMDLIQRNGFNDGPVAVFKVYFAQPDGSFVLQNTYSPFSGQPFTSGLGTPGQSSFLGDFKGDGAIDIAAFQQESGSPSHFYVQFLLGNGDGTFTPSFKKFQLGVGSSAMPSFVTDMDGDGKADLVELDGFTSAFNIVHAAPGKLLTLQYVFLPVIGTKGVARVSLALPAAQDTVLQLSASDPGIGVPASVTVPAGSLSADINFTVNAGFDVSHTFSITATNGLESVSAVGSVAVPGGAIGLIMDVGTPPLISVLPSQSISGLTFAAASRGGYQTTVNVGCSAPPAGFTCRFGTTTVDVAPGSTNQTTLAIDVAPTVAIGDYTVNVVAQDIAISQTFPILIHVGDFALNAFSTAGPARPTGEQFFRVEVQSINHGGGSVQFSCTGLPAGAACNIAPNFAGNTAENFSVVTNNVPIGDFPFSVVGSVGSISHTIGATLHVGDFGSASIAPTTATLSVGQSAVFDISVASVNGFNDSVNLACATSVNGHATSGVGCAFSPSPATFDATGKLSAKMTVTISARPQSFIAGTSSRSLMPLAVSATTFLLVGVVLAAIPKRRRTGMVLSAICIVVLGSIVACGGGGGGGRGGGATPTPSPTPTPTPQPALVRIDVLGASTSQSGQTRKTLTSINVTVQ